MKWITASDITNWAATKQRECADTLPELIRRLIFYTATSIKDIEFPIGDSVAGAGWDGRLDTATVSPFFPLGQSGWEMGADKSAKTKADGDYATRLLDSHGLVHSDTTFVFVTPRMWPGRVKWQREKQLEGHWRGVRVIAADALEQWLDSAPAVALWLARITGKVVSDGIRDLEDFWEEWSLSTKPPMTTAIVVAGRTVECDRIHTWISGKADKLAIQGDSQDEAFAFLYAAIGEMAEGDRTKALSRAVLVDDITDMRNCIRSFQYPLVIAASGDCIPAVGQAVSKGHHVYLATDSNVVDPSRVYRLGRPKIGTILSCLEDSGLSRQRAEQITRDFGRSIPVLHRHLSASGVVRRPAWADPGHSQLSLVAFHVGSWSAATEGDREILELLTGTAYEVLEPQFESLRLSNDSPIDRISDVWRLKSPLDSWFLLSRSLTNDSLNRLERAIITVIGETDPKYELSADQRWMAAAHDKTRRYSVFLRSGLIESLALMAVFGDRAPDSISTKSFTTAIVRRILSNADSWQKRASLDNAMPLIAETSPGAFLDAVQQDLACQPRMFGELFTDEGGPIFGECKHSGLLWALESIAWSSDHFDQAVRVLSELAAVDPGGQWANRPESSLKNIFNPRYPQTHATPGARLTAFDSLMERDARLCWRMTKAYLDRDFITASHQFRWRQTDGERRGLEPDSQDNYSVYIAGLMPKLLQLATLPENLMESVDDFTRFPFDFQNKIASAIVDLDPNEFTSEERMALLGKIREALNWINGYGDEEARTVVPELMKALVNLEPEDVLERVGWLLSTPWPTMPQGHSDNLAEDEDAVALAQKEAAREILDCAPFDEILKFAGTVEYVGVLGGALGRAIESDEEDQRVLDNLVGAVGEIRPGEISSYASSRVQITGQDWIRGQIDRLQAQGINDPEVFALLLLGLPEGEATWIAVSNYGYAVEEAYWKRASGWSRSDRVGDVEIAVVKLLDVKRPDAALPLAGDPKVSLPSALLKRLLQQLLTLDKPEYRLHRDSMITFHLAYVFRQLHERDELGLEEIAALEWPYAALFDDLKRNLSSPPAIHRLLQKDPVLFAHLISLLYRRDDGDRGSDEVSEDEQLARVAYNAREVIESWHLLPGLHVDGVIDEDELGEWIRVARQKCTESKHTAGVDIEIGRLLAHSPNDSDGNWPHVAVRNQIELLASGVIDSHVAMGLYNKRGVTVRSPGEGGRQERELARHYGQMSESLKVKWPRTAAILRSMAESYELDAKRQDADAELRGFR